MSTRRRFRSAISGRYTSAEYAKANPDTTVAHRERAKAAPTTTDEKVYRIGGATIAFCDGWTEITLNSGKFLSIAWTEQDGQAEQARKLGYASAVDLNKDHDALHILVAHMLGLPDSGPLTFAATGETDPHWYLEEDIVFAISRYITAKGWTAEKLIALHARAA